MSFGGSKSEDKNDIYNKKNRNKKLHSVRKRLTLKAWKKKKKKANIDDIAAVMKRARVRKRVTQIGNALTDEQPFKYRIKLSKKAKQH
jgi:hypothetical protein